MPKGSDSTTVVANDPRARRSGKSDDWCLVTIHGPGLGQRYDLGEEDGPLTVGRGPANHVVVPLKDVSREHCRVVRRHGACLVTDLGSTNGTYLNDRRLTAYEELALQPGDQLNLGGVIFKVLDGSDVEARYHDELYRTAIIDGLTGLHNRRYLNEFVEREIHRSRRYDRALALLLLDVDHFKRINDEHGHLAGDSVLRDLATTLKRQVRSETCCARYGGEEFAIVLPETHPDEARIVAERIRGAVEHHTFQLESGELPVTVSIGIASLEDPMETPTDFFQAADEKLYAAKHAGRNRVA